MELRRIPMDCVLSVSYADRKILNIIERFIVKNYVKNRDAT